MNRLKQIVILFCFTCFSVSAFADMHLYTLHAEDSKPLTDNKLHLYFCGTGDPEVGMQAIRKPSCLAVIADKHFFVIDTGDGAASNLGALGLPLEKINDIFVTHLHSDHIAGIGYLNNLAWLAGRKQPVTLHGPAGINGLAKYLNQAYFLDGLFRASNRGGAYDIANSQFHPKLVMVPEAGESKPIYQQPNLSLTAFRVDHSPVYPALGFVIHYKSCKIVISGDTKVMPNLANVSQNADVLINEAFSHVLGQAYLKAQAGNGDSANTKRFYQQTAHYHSDTLELAKMASKAAVKQLILTHLVPSIPTTQKAKDLFTQGMSEFYNRNIIVANDRDELTIADVGGRCEVDYKPSEQPSVSVLNITD